jgi:hypothetical protein
VSIPIPDMEQSTTIWYLRARVQFESASLSGGLTKLYISA